jgi:hypothetical protein
MDALVLTGADPDTDIETRFRQRFAARGVKIDTPIFFERDLPSIAALIRRAHLARINCPACDGGPTF